MNSFSIWLISFLGAKEFEECLKELQLEHDEATNIKVRHKNIIAGSHKPNPPSRSTSPTQPTLLRRFQKVYEYDCNNMMQYEYDCNGNEDDL